LYAGWDVVEFFEGEETDTQGFGMYNDKAIIISFRGTVGKRDWMTNLDYCPVPYPLEVFLRFPGADQVRVYSHTHTPLAPPDGAVSDFERRQGAQRVQHGARFGV
jgi:hypothetical protein